MEMVQHVLTRSDTNQLKKRKEKHSSNECHKQDAPAFVWINCMDIAYGMEEAVDLRNGSTPTTSITFISQRMRQNTEER